MKRPAEGPAGRLRVIGGEWRSRLIEVPPSAALRPTPDRVRQTLFDWLAPVVYGARVIDAFAGTGALGIEALSRGAREAVFLESDAAVAKSIATALERLGARRRVSVHCADAVAWLGATREMFDIVFLDPPFASRLFEPVLPAMSRVLAPGGVVYLEWRADTVLHLPPELEWHRTKKAGQVSYGLALRRGNIAWP